MTFQEQLITLRKQQGLSQEQLGSKLGVTRQTVSKWELGITTPKKTAGTLPGTARIKAWRHPPDCI